MQPADFNSIFTEENFQAMKTLRDALCHEGNQDLVALLGDFPC